MNIVGENVSLGTSSFAEYIKSRLVYVDKTSLIRELFGTTGTVPLAKVTLITRPRRFGKTTMMTMLREFFSCTCTASKNLFAQLEIAQYPALCEAWQNQYPVLMLSFKDLNCGSFKHAKKSFQVLLHEELQRHVYLLDSQALNEAELNYFSRLNSLKLENDELPFALKFFISALKAHWDKPVIVLLDEYDVPLNYASQNGYYPEMLDFMRNLLNPLKDDEKLSFAVLTGCLRVSKESLFTGLNNFRCYDVTNSRFADKFGFTHEETAALLKKFKLEAHLETVKKWYDGYLMGSTQNVYCPWDVMNYLADLTEDNNARPQMYWENTGSNNIFLSLIRKYSLNLKGQIEKLAHGECITAQYNNFLNYSSLDSSLNNFWMLLLAAGYLTPAPDQENTGNPAIKLKIPNLEVLQLFTKTMDELLQRRYAEADLPQLINAFLNLDEKAITAFFERFLYATISYHDYNESFYHGVVTGLLGYAGEDISVESNQESGLGRPDIVITDLKHRKAVIIELKTAADPAHAEQAVLQALEQITDRQYAKPLLDQDYEAILVGIAFYGKACKVRCQAAAA